MKLRRRTLLQLAAASGAVSVSSRMAPAQTFPARPITIVVPFPAGGPTDTLGRVLADRMRNALGQSVIIENLTGAAGTIGSAHVARSSPDGYTLILGHWQTHVVNGATFTIRNSTTAAVKRPIRSRFLSGFGDRCAPKCSSPSTMDGR